MRRILAFSLALMIVSQAFINLGITVYWLANHAYIATILCENKDNPALHCDGKCYLRKKMAETTDSSPSNDTSKSLNLKKSLELAEFPAETPVVFIPQLTVIPAIQIPVTQSCLGILPETRIFHPPSMTAIA
jgi:hypothetical protein